MPYYINVKGHAQFHDGSGNHWSSHHVTVRFGINWRSQRVYVDKKYGQAPLGKKGRYVKPHFAPAEMARIKARAQHLLDDKLQNRRKKTGEQDPWVQDAPDAAADAPHEQELCERCAELGFNCTTRTTTILEIEDEDGNVKDVPIYIKNIEQWKQRCDRVAKSKPTTLFHQTSADAAKAILKSQKMKRGSAGSLGGGIYFAETPEATNAKALQKGVILKCTVRLGNVMHLKKVDPSMTFAKLFHQRRDSVRCTAFGTGPEVVVYNKDQVIKIEKY